MITLSDLNWMPVMKLSTPSHIWTPIHPPNPPFFDVTSTTPGEVFDTQKSLTPLRDVSSQASPQLGSFISWNPAAQLFSGQNSESPQLPQLLPADGLSSYLQNTISDYFICKNANVFLSFLTKKKLNSFLKNSLPHEVCKRGIEEWMQMHC